MKKIYALVTTLIVAGSATVYAQPGSLDIPYGDMGNGKALVSMSSDPNSPSNGMNASLILPGDKLLLGGGVSVGGFKKFALLQMLPNGTPDSSFGVNGRAFFNPYITDQELFSIARQQDGKIVAAGYSTDSFALVRFMADGTPDAGFGNDGMVTGVFTSTWGSAGSAVVVQPDGKIVMGAVGDQTFCSARFNTDGTPDNSFGTNGRAVYYFNFPMGDMFVAKAMVLQADGKIVMGGTHNPFTMPHMFLARIKTDGTLDSSFGVNGAVDAIFDNTDGDELNALALQPDGKIVAAGFAGSFSDDGFALQRFNTDGSIDNNFGTNGKVLKVLTTGATNKATTIALQPDGKIVAGGLTGFGPVMNFGLLRLNADGTSDATFDTDGMVVTDMASSIDEVTTVALQSDGKIVLAGNSYNGSNIQHVGLARYLIGPATSVFTTATNKHDLELYPNPVGEAAVINFTLTNNQKVSINLYDVTGRLAHSFVHTKPYEAGTNAFHLQWPAHLPAGVYTLSLVAGNEVNTVKVVKK